ncbi:MAG TPA: polyphosphate polymerase domain-containing protein [Bacteroidia bacterium]|nr:polyphosphate polymerase domain-containing protein [Bacteroidia bacterium]HRH07428.1 polyphosphate polymerase domain-containing protein [Bacteroidia bacterium]HRH62246.1 polyphosphate polymerase domain-containing protein [Bacteroidia bacterium]
MEELDKIIQAFQPISLTEMDSVKLMDRTDTKFVFHIRDLKKILDKIVGHYRALEVEGSRWSPYETLYFDTPKLELYLRHHNQKLNRFKIRYRKYVNSNLHFFEIKFKNNKGRTIKKRIKQTQIENDINGNALQLLQTMTPFKEGDLKPVLFVNCSRATLVNIEHEERLTLDVKLQFVKNSTEINFEPLVIAELKQAKVNIQSPFYKLMKHYRFRSSSMSKYCFGVTQLFPDIKKNNFKPKILTLNKIIHATTTSNE